MAQSMADINTYLDTIIGGSMGVKEMRQEIEARMAHMKPEIAVLYEKMLESNPPLSMSTWAALVLESRDDMKKHSRWEDTVIIPHLSADEIAVKYPRLIRAMKWAAILSDGEAACALRDYRDGYAGREWGGEAVNHFGGPLAVIQAAIKGRHRVPPAFLMSHTPRLAYSAEAQRWY